MGHPVCLHRNAGLLRLADHPGYPRPRHHRGCDNQYGTVSYYAQLVQDLGVCFLRAHADIVGSLLFRPARVCPADPKLELACIRTQIWNRRIFWTSAVIWGIGFFAAFLALPLRIWLDF